LVKGIISKSSEPPIIVLQSDHGPASTLDWNNPNNTSYHERSAILNAYYFPEGGDKKLYQTISPVNSFRQLLNNYFDKNYKMLDDRTYFSRFHAPYDLVEVTNKVP